MFYIGLVHAVVINGKDDHEKDGGEWEGGEGVQ